MNIYWYEGKQIYRQNNRKKRKSLKHDTKIILYSVTDWPSEWQTENSTKVNVFNKEIFFIKEILYRYFKSYKTNKKMLVTEWVSDWLMDKHVHRGTSLLNIERRETAIDT